MFITSYDELNWNSIYFNSQRKLSFIINKNDIILDFNFCWIWKNI